LVGAVTQLLPYIGYPRALNALRVIEHADAAEAASKSRQAVRAQAANWHGSNLRGARLLSEDTRQIYGRWDDGQHPGESNKVHARSCINRNAQ
jgi:hypothetical protein